MCQCKMRFSFPHRDICTTKWAVCVCGTRGRLFSDHKMNHEAAEEFHNLCVKSSICDLDYWSQPGTATLLPPRGSDNKTQLLGKIIARRHQNNSPHASILLALKGFYLQRTPHGEQHNHQEQSRSHRFPLKPAPLHLPPQHHLPSSSPSQKPGSHSWLLPTALP